MVARYDGPGRRVDAPNAPRGARADAPRRVVDSSLGEVGADLVGLSRQMRATDLQAEALEEQRLERAEREAERARLKQERIDRQESLGVASDLEVSLSQELVALEQQRGADPTGWGQTVRQSVSERVKQATEGLRPGLAEFVQERLTSFVERASIQAIGQEAQWQGVRSVETHASNADALARLAAFRPDGVADALVELKAGILEDPFIAAAAKRAVFEEQAGKVALAQVDSLLSQHPEAAVAIQRAVTGELSASSPFVTVPVGGRKVDLALGLVAPGKLVDVVERSQRELQTRAREAAVAAREQQADQVALLKQDVGDILTAAEYGEPVGPVSRDRFAVLGERADQAYQQFDQQYRAATQRGAVRTQTRDELVALLESSRPQAGPDGAPGFADAAKQYEATQRVVVAELERRSKAPVAYAHEVSDPLRAATALVDQARAAGDRKGLQAAASRRIDLLFETQAAYGLPPTLLDPGEKAAVAARLSGDAIIGAAPKERAVARVQALDLVMDEYGEYASDVLRAVGKDAPAGTATQARLRDRPSETRLALAEAWDTPAETLARALPVSYSAKDITLDARDSVEAFMRSLGTRQGAVGTGVETQQSVERLAMVYAARGVSDPVGRATADVIGEYAFEEVAGRVVRVPANERLDQVAPGLKRALANERERFPEERDLNWVTLPDDRGVQLLSGETPVLSGKEPVVRTWLEVREVQATVDERARTIQRDVEDALFGSGMLGP
jgi:hypothetical protein